MTIQLENAYFIATIAEEGAELVSLKSKRTTVEYIWQGDATYWARHAPVLFPIVGRLKNDQYLYNNQTFKMTQHGFARDSLFTVCEQGAELVSLSLKSSIETKKMYPFDFELIITYMLEDDQLVTKYQVENTGSEDMYFSIGGHPAFNLPLNKELSFDDYFFSISPSKSRNQIPLVGPYADFDKKIVAQTGKKIDLDYNLFKNDALIYETTNMTTVSIATEADPRSVSLTYSTMPYVGIWSPYGKNAPFICIEPWCGIADTVDATGDLSSKVGINKLASKDLFKTQYTISVT